MTHPEKGASYRYQPKWLERATLAERADGGTVPSNKNSNDDAAQVARAVLDFMPGNLPIVEAARQIPAEAVKQLSPGVLPITEAIRKLSNGE